MLQWLNSLSRRARIGVIAGTSALGLSIIVVFAATIYNLALPVIVTAEVTPTQTPSASSPKPSPKKTVKPSARATATPTPSTSASEETPAAASQPRNVTINSAGDQAVVSWSIPADSGTDPLTGYVVELSVNGQGLQTVATTGPNQRTYQLSGLSASTTYSVAIRAISAAGSSERSAVSSFATPVFTPSSPRGLVPRQASCGPTGCSVTVYFDSSASEGISAITDYQLVYSIDGGGSWSQMSLGPNAGVFATGEIPLASSYQIAVIAYNAYGASPWSNVITVPGVN